MDDKIKNLIEYALMKDTESHIIKAFNRYGLEGTKEKIEELYSNTPKLREHMLKIYNDLLNKKILDIEGDL